MFKLALVVAAVQQGKVLPGDVVGVQIEPSLRDRELEWIKGEAYLKVGPVLVFESCVAECTSGGIAAGKELRELDVLVLLDLWIASFVAR